MHACAERLVPRVAAAAKRKMLSRRAGIAGYIAAIGFLKRNRAGDAVRTVLRYFDCRGPCVVKIHRIACFDAIDRETESARGTVANCADDFVHPTAAGSDKRLRLGMKDCGQSIGAKSRMLARPTIIENTELLSYVRAALVGHAFGVFYTAELYLRVPAIAIRFDRRGTTSTECHKRSRGQWLTEPIEKTLDVFYQEWTVG